MPVTRSEVRISPLHYRPKTGNAGDAIAFFWQGQHHVFYLHQAKWDHIVSTDLVHWKDLPPALLPCEDPTGPDANCWTGSVVEHGGTFYLFYTGQNPQDPKNDQKVMLATSKDLIAWEKQPDRTFYPEGRIYWSKSINGPIPGMGYHHQAFRDPDVFWHEGQNQWWMLLHALTAEGHEPCIALYTSPDLLDWTPHAPLAVYTAATSLDCPHAAPVQGRWFLMAADTCYVSTDKPEGPYPPDMNLYDSGDLFVPKSLFDGKRRLIGAGFATWKETATAATRCGAARSVCRARFFPAHRPTLFPPRRRNHGGLHRNRSEPCLRANAKQHGRHMAIHGRQTWLRPGWRRVSASTSPTIT